MSVLQKLARSAVREAMRAPRLANYASSHHSVDEWVLDDLKASSPVFREALERPIAWNDKEGGEVVYEPSGDIHDDIFLTAHAPGESRVRPEQEIKPSHHFGRNVLDEFVKTDAHRAAKPYTEGDELGSAIYARAAIDEFDKLMADKAVREQVEQSQNLAEQEQQLEQILEQLKGKREEAKDAHDKGEPIPGPLVDEIKDLTNAREQAAGQLAQDAADQTAPPTDVVRAAVNEAAEKAKERAEAWGTIAGLGGNELAHANPDEAWALADAWMQVPDFKELCKLIGKVIRDFRAQDAKNVIGGDDHVIGIELGANLSRTLPTELARLGSPLLHASFLKDFTDESLLQFETEGSEKVEMGPGVLCLDMSGSMGGRKATEAKAVVVGFIRLMHKKNRDAVVIAFNGRPVWEHHFPKRQALDLKALLALASFQPNGGTDITAAVVRAQHYIERSPTFKKADLLVVTDGQSAFGTQAATIRDGFRAKGVRSHGIAIGHRPMEGGWLLQFCDDAISVQALTEATGDIVRAIS
jgi:uncharacterized protein with von Willebrand factor type A (vWA) domain